MPLRQACHHYLKQAGATASHLADPAVFPLLPAPCFSPSISQHPTLQLSAAPFPSLSCSAYCSLVFPNGKLSEETRSLCWLTERILGLGAIQRPILPHSASWLLLLGRVLLSCVDESGAD